MLLRCEMLLHSVAESAVGSIELFGRVVTGDGDCCYVVVWPALADGALTKKIQENHSINNFGNVLVLWL